MSWTKLNFGKNNGKTLPHVLFTDPDWFFWVIDSGAFDDKPALKAEATELNRKARNIKIPDTGTPRIAEYFILPSTGKFAHFDLIPESRGKHHGPSSAGRLDVIDMSFPKGCHNLDKDCCKRLIKSLKLQLFGNASTPMTKRKCEAFFEDDTNFAI